MFSVFSKDLHYAQRCVYIESPFITTRRVNELLPVLNGSRQKNLAITVNTRHPDEHDGRYGDKAFYGIKVMQELGIKVLYLGRNCRVMCAMNYPAPF